MSAVVAALLLLCGLSLAGVGCFIDRALLAREPALAAGLLALPLAAFACAAGAAGLYFAARVERRRERAAFWSLLSAAFLLEEWLYRDHRDSLGEAARLCGQHPLRVWALLLAALALFSLLRLIRPLHRFAAGWAAATLALVLWSSVNPVDGVGVNRFGLAAYPPGALVKADYNADASERYPAGAYAYNSLGYRDEEPAAEPGGRTVLLIGGFFVSGLGIAANAETLPALLRGELARGRWNVVAAAFPCNGLYGYERALQALAPVFRPAVAVIGYASDLDEAALDSQAVVDRTPGPSWIRRLLPVLWLRDYVHTVAARREVQSADPALRERQVLFAQAQVDALERTAAASGTRLVFLHYRPDLGRLRLAPGVRRLVLPDELFYKGRPDEFWYAQEATPRPAFNRRVAALLAAEVAR